MAQPLSKGNFIVLKGDKRASGKHLAVQGAVQSFLSEDANHKAVYVSLSDKSANNFHDAIDSK